MWMAAHMRRGDFVTVGCMLGSYLPSLNFPDVVPVSGSMEKSIQDHLSRIRSHLDSGRRILANISEGAVIPPLEGDP